MTTSPSAPAVSQDDEDVAAVMAVLAALRSRSAALSMTKPAAPRSFWGSRYIRHHGATIYPGQGSWWATGRDR